MYIIPLHFFFL